MQVSDLHVDGLEAEHCADIDHRIRGGHRENEGSRSGRRVKPHEAVIDALRKPFSLFAACETLKSGQFLK